ncbi:MAG: hypothetical protein LBT59_14100 [Clostridiales bacterium]|nr:hypothetical protein [Clostridiales bacterium]
MKTDKQEKARQPSVSAYRARIRYSGLEIFLLAALTLLLFWAQMTIADMLRYAPLWDAGEVFNGAASLSLDEGLHRSYYFATFPNNVGLTLFLSWMYKLYALVSGKPIDFFMAYSGTLAVIVEFGVLMLYDTIKRYLNKKTAIIMLVVLLLYLPTYLLPSVLYTDVASMSAQIAGLNMFIRLRERKRSVWSRLLISMFMGIFIGIGASFKVTAGIIFIAIFLMAWIPRRRKKKTSKLKFGFGLYGYLMLSAIIILLLVMAPRWISEKNYITAEQKERYEIPIIHWIMMGLNEKDLERMKWVGTEVSEDYGIVKEIETMEERKQYAMDEIIRRIEEKTPEDFVRLYMKKMRVLYGRVDMAPGALIPFSGVEDDQGNPELRAFLDEFRWTTPYLVWNGVIFYGCLALAILSIFCRKRSGLALLAFLGFNVFFLVWEVNSRQIINFFFILVFMASICVYSMTKRRAKRKKGAFTGMPSFVSFEPDVVQVGDGSDLEQADGQGGTVRRKPVSAYPKIP